MGGGGVVGFLLGGLNTKGIQQKVETLDMADTATGLTGVGKEMQQELKPQEARKPGSQRGNPEREARERREWSRKRTGGIHS